ncbi:MAG TPA: cupin domain-containing protein [Mycobacteriales bacterium]
MTTTAASVWPDWRTVVQVREEGPDVTLLHESAELKVVLVALAAGQGLPEHPGPAACFHILEGEGVVLVDGDEIRVSAGATAVVPTGSIRAVRATTSLVFLGNLGDPGAENGPH